MDLTDLLNNIADFSKKSKPRSKEDKDKKKTFGIVSALYEGWELTFNAFRNGIFPIKEKKGKGLKILTPKQMLRKLPIALAQVKAGNTSENFLIEIRQIMYFLYREKEITKSIQRYNELNKVIKQQTEWILYLWILRVVKHLILADYHSIFQIK